MDKSKASYFYRQEIFFSLAISAMVAIIIVDTSVVKLYHLTVNPKISEWALSIFITLSSLIVILQFLSLDLVNKTISKNVSDRIRFRKLNITTTVVQIILASIMCYLILEMILLRAYTTAMLIYLTSASYFLATFLIILLSYRLVRWFRLNRNLPVLLYGIAACTLAVNLVLTVLLVDLQLLSKPSHTPSHIGFFSPFFTPRTSDINLLYIATSALSFATMWLANVILLKNSFKALRKPYKTTIFWFMMIIPLIYFMTQFQPFFRGIFSPLLSSEPLLYGMILTLIFAWSKTIGGILFYLPFRLAAGRLQKNSNLRRYLVFSAIGMLMVFASNQAIVLVAAPYPPFGVPTVSIMGLSSYFLFLGIYLSAIAIGQDAQLRKFVRRTAESDSDLLHSIGSAYMEEEIILKFVRITKQHASSLQNETGVGLEPSVEDVKDYLKEVIKDLERNK